MRAAITLLLAFAAWWQLAAELKPAPAPRSTIARLLTDADARPGFDYALAPRTFDFPSDHAAHPGFRSEWWYFTANLVSDEGRAFGIQLTIFRFALRARRTTSASPWRANDLYLGHFAVSDLANERFVAVERRVRPALGQAGVTAKPLRIWTGDWIIARRDGTDENWRLTARDGDTGIDIDLRAARPVIAQGDRGLSHKSADRGNASFYYSIPRLTASGRVTVAGAPHQVQGSAWFDHEWSTSALAEGQRGWDWFSLQLDDGREIMFYQIRDADGRANPASRGIVVNADGTTHALLRDEIDREITAYWRSPATGARYPAGWRLKIPELRLNLNVAPRLSDQEWHTTLTYWEGAVSVSGEDDGKAITGVGYVELVGY